MKTRWQNGNKMVEWKQDGGMETRWWNGNKLVEWKQVGGMETRGREWKQDGENRNKNKQLEEKKNGYFPTWS